MKRLEADVLVIGSGPGGATTACALAEAGRDVLIVEEGAYRPVGSAEPYSLQEMDQKWRNGGLTPAFGPVKVTYVEGRCVGGASEINAALYHPPLDDVLDMWRDRYQLEGFGADALRPFVVRMEREMSVSTFPESPGLASERLREGAKALGWKSAQVARFWKYDRPGGRRQSMTETLIPRARAAGARLEAGVKIRRLLVENGRAVGAEGRNGKEKVSIRAGVVFVCAGAVQSALILRRSGIRTGIGDTLTMNPMIRMAARFDAKVNEPELGVPVEQIEEFKPLMTLGCSHSSLAHLALWLAGDAAARERYLPEWEKLGVFYAKVMAKARGVVRNVPGFDEAFVRYRVGPEDLATLGDAAVRLGRVLFAAGARSIINPVPGGTLIEDERGLDALRAGVEAGAVQLTAIHLHSTVPMGGPTDSWGKLRALQDVWVNDASLLPDTPGINPQGTILSIARRNVEKFLEG